MEAGRRDGDLWGFRGRNNSANDFLDRAMREDFSTPKFAPNAQNGGVATLRGFVLQSSYRVVSRPNGQRIPVIHIYGRLESGGTFLVRDDRQRPHFFIRAADADVLCVAYGAPAQDLWIRRNLSRLPVAVAMGVGGAYDFLSGRQRRAPYIMQRMGLEWLYRLYREPWRWRRMLAIPRFMLQVILRGRKKHD